ncbi:hypothetical protein PCE1_003140 [Barthelona sp. PCE]
MKTDIKSIIRAAAFNTGVLSTPIFRAGHIPTPSYSRRYHNSVGENVYSVGTVGGGPLEFACDQLVDTVMAEETGYVQYIFLTAQSIDSNEPTCGGRAAVLVEPTTVTHSLLEQFSTILDERKPFYEVIVFETDHVTNAEHPDDENFTVAHPVQFTRHIIPTCALESYDIEDEAKHIISNFDGTEEYFPMSNNRALYLAYHRPHPKLYIFGAGHVGQKVAPIATIAGFETVLVDNRQGLLDILAPSNEYTTVFSDYTDIIETFGIQSCDYAVIVTYGHKHDHTVVLQLLPVHLKYVGMIGSRVKVAAMRRKLSEEGFTQQDIDSVYAPIGLPIGGDTAGEIAVGIVAQLIKVKTGGKKGNKCGSK